MSAEGGDGQSAKRLRVGDRTMLACTNCKQRKLKCDGQTPKCSTCAKNNRDCLVEDPATGLHRPRDYMRSLEARVAYLENLLQEVLPEVAHDHLGAIPTVPDVDEQSTTSASAIPFALGRGHAHSGGEMALTDPGAPGTDVLSSEVALLCVSAAGREPQYFGPSSALSFSRIASSVMGPAQRGRVGSSQPSSHGEGAPNLRAVRAMEFPSPSRMAQLSQAYFSSIHPQYPFLHEPTVHRMEQECLEANRRGSLSAAGEASLFFVLMVSAIGSLTLGHGEVDAAEGYYALALDCMSPLIEMDGLPSIQAILCCAVYSIRSPFGVSLWKLSGMAMRHCVELGYHRSVVKYRNAMDPLANEMSKRCFWVAYDIDRVASFILGRPVGISDAAVDVEPPSDINDEDITKDGFRCSPRSDPSDPPTTMTGALHAIKLRQLWSKFSDNIYPNVAHSPGERNAQFGVSIETLRQELEDWRATTPDTYDHSNLRPLSVFASKSWFQLAYNYSILLLYRHYIMESPDASYSQQLQHACENKDAVDRAFEVCADHARDICIRYRQLYQTQGSHLQFTWGSLHILFLGGLTYLYCLWRSPYVRQQVRPATVINTCMACTTVLVIIAERWPQAGAYRDIFESLSERTVNMVCGDNGGAAVQSTALFNPAAMPHLEDAELHNTYNGSGADVDNPVAPNLFMPLQDWITSLEDMGASGDSQWLAQELFQGMRGPG
ncbi:hypothetical protein GQ53DRAFT_838243 [Thozetella sp. PMI_491]|nr:hypothetical protein GQ53DRAFT_838243 [Thozetella sp. PMI_491]